MRAVPASISLESTGLMRRVVRVEAEELNSVMRLRGLSEQALDAVEVIVFGCTEAMHDWHTSREGSFRRAVAGLRRARAARLTVVATCPVTRSNYRHLAEVVRVAHTLGLRAARFQLAPVGGASPPPPPAMLSPHLARAVDTARTLGFAVVTPVHAVPEEARDWFSDVDSVAENM